MYKFQIEIVKSLIYMKKIFACNPLYGCLRELKNNLETIRLFGTSQRWS